MFYAILFDVMFIIMYLMIIKWVLSSPKNPHYSSAVMRSIAFIDQRLESFFL